MWVLLDSASLNRGCRTGQIKELEKKLQETIGRQVTAMREAALEQNAELNEAICIA